MKARSARRVCRMRRFGGPLLLNLALTLALAHLASTTARAAGSSAAPATASSSSASSGSSFPAKVEDFADCTLPAPGWDNTHNKALSQAFNTDDWPGVQDILTGVIRELSCKNSKTLAPIKNLHLSKRYFSVLFFDENSQPPALARVVVHRYHGNWKVVNPPDADKPEVYGSRIGAFELYDLRLLPEGFLVSSQYLVGTSANPLITQIPGVIGQIAGGVKTSGLIPAPAAPPGALTTAAPSLPAGQQQFILKAQPKGERALPPDECTNSMVSDLPECKLEKLPPRDQDFIVRRVTVPPTFKPHFLRQPSVIPQVSIADQVVFSSQFESYMLTSLRQRAADADQKLGTVKVGSLEQKLFRAYYGCRIHVSTDLTVSPTGKPRYLIARVLNPAGGPPLPDLCLGFGVEMLDASGMEHSPRVLLPRLLPGEPRTVCWAAPKDADGNYLATAEVFDEQRSLGVPKVELEDAAAATFFALSSTSSQLSGTLTPSAAAPNWGDPFSLAFAVGKNSIGNSDIRVTIFDSATGKHRKDAKVTRDLSMGDTTGALSFSTAEIGLGTRIAVLDVTPQGKQTVPLASASFRVVGGMPGNQPGSSAIAAGPACLVVDDSSLTDHMRPQQAFVAYSDIASAYSWLLAQATPPPQAAGAPTTYTLGKLTRFAFSLGVAGMLPSNLHKQSNPSTTPLSWVALDIHPFTYDETRFSPDWKERLRGFLGIAITPDAGVVGGMGIGVLRGLTVEGGYSLLLASVVKPNQPVPPPGTSPATYRGVLGSWFVGLGYSLQ